MPPELGLDGKEKPVYAEGALVEFDLGTGPGIGRIRGLAMKSLMDYWIVEITKWPSKPKDFYPYTCVVIQHTLLKPL